MSLATPTRVDVAPLRPAAERATGASTVGRMILLAAERGDDAALRYPPAGQTATISYAQMAVRCRGIARGALGLQSGDMVSILSSTRVEELEHVVMIDGAAPGAITVDDLLRRGEEVDVRTVDRRIEAVAPEDLVTIVYTSGTTGPPKGCALSHANFIAAITMSRGMLQLDDVQPVVYQFLPLAHVFARVIQTVVLDVGGTLVFWSGDSKRILGDLAEAAPTHLPAVPRIYEKVHTAVMSDVQRQSPARRTVFRWALAEGRRTVVHRRRRNRVTVSDDPDGAAVLARGHAQWTALPQHLRARIHLALLPMDDPEENAAVVNALQRGAEAVVQKRLAEGFGFTVAEAMGKSRPVAASRFGGIQDQIEDGASGVLLDDPRDLPAFGRGASGLLDGRAAAAAMGCAGALRVRDHFLGPHSLLAYLELLGRLL